jgi:hypothetical protein
VRADVVRRGGIAGLTMHGTIDTDTLEPSERERVEPALRGLPFGRPPAPPTHPDGFTYEITVHEGDGSRTATIGESELPVELGSALQLTP